MKSKKPKTQKGWAVYSGDFLISSPICHTKKTTQEMCAELYRTPWHELKTMGWKCLRVEVSSL